MPVRLLPIPVEELEHVDDKILDADFELRLLNEGDDLRPIHNAVEIASMFSENAGEAADDVSQTVLSNGSTPNKAIDIAVEMGSADERPTEMPVLPDNPSESDLIDFAENHPLVKPVLRLFRGKVVSVKKK